MERPSTLSMYLLWGTIFFTPGVLGASDSAFSKALKPIIEEIHAKTPQNKPVVVVPFQDMQGNITSLGGFISEQVQICLANQSVEVVERRALQTALEEEKLRQTGLLDEGTVLRLGRAVGARIAVYGSATESEKLISLNLKIVDIERGVTISGVTHDIERNRSINQIIKTFPDHYTEEIPTRVPNTNYSLGFSYLYALPTNPSQFGVGNGGMLTLIHKYGDYWDLEMGAGGFVRKMKEDVLHEGSNTIVPMVVGARFHVFGDKSFSPYLNAGLGAFVNARQVSNADKPSNICADKTQSCPEKFDVGGSFYMGAGINIYTDQCGIFAINLDGKYLPANAEIGNDENASPAPKYSTKINVGAVLLSAGVLYRY